MTARERFLATLTGGQIDKHFLWEAVFLKEAVERWRREGLPAEADPFEYFGFERVGHAGISCGFDPALAERVIADEGDSELVEDEAGGVLRRYKTNAPNAPWEGASHRIKFPLRDRASWKILKKHMNPSSPNRPLGWKYFVEGTWRGPTTPAEYHDGSTGSLVPEDGVPTVCTAMGPTYWLIRLAGLDNMAVMLYDEPRLVEEIYDYLSWFTTSQMEPVFAKRVPDALFLNEEGAIKGGPFMSPAMYRRLVCPKLRQITDVCIRAGVRLIFVESGGDVTSLVPLWKEVGVNGVIPLDVSGGTNPVQIRRDHPDLALIGGIDRTVLATDRGRIQREIERTARILLAEGKSIPSLDAHGLDATVSFDNMCCYAECLQKEAARSLSRG